MGKIQQAQRGQGQQDVLDGHILENLQVVDFPGVLHIQIHVPAEDQHDQGRGHAAHLLGDGEHNLGKVGVSAGQPKQQGYKGCFDQRIEDFLPIERTEAGQRPGALFLKKNGINVELKHDGEHREQEQICNVGRIASEDAGDDGHGHEGWIVKVDR